MRASPRICGALAATFLAGKALAAAYSSYNGLAITPAMGWDNWNAYACDVSQDLLLQTGQKMVDFGLRDLGYQYVILDDCWSNGRMDNGTLVANATKFPNGMKYVSDQLHGMGLKFGMYSSAGKYTCAYYQGSLGYEQIDADFFAASGVDYLKYDNCYNQGQSGTPQLSFNRYNVMSEALNKTGRPILYGLCNWGEDSPWDWGQTMSNSYRMSGDIYDSFSRPDPRCPCIEAFGCRLPGFHCSVLNILNKMAAITSKSQSGAFNDMDGLEVGNGGMTDEEYKLHFSMWAMNSSPLIMGTDVTAMTPQTLSIYSNAAVIALNQDPSASGAVRIWRYLVPDKDQYGQGEISFWVRSLANGDMAIAFVNAGTMNRTMNATLAQVFYDTSTGGSSGPAPQIKETWDVYDLWANRMSDSVAQAILNGNSSSAMYTYNATAISYADGLAANSSALFGSKLNSSIPPSGTITVNVPGHAVGLYRLRQASSSSMRKKDEL